MQTLQRTAVVLIWPALASLGAACDQLDAPTAVVQAGIIPGGGPGKATGGGQIDIVDATGATIGKGTFGFNARREEGTDGAVRGHVNYVNHVTGVHLNCEVESGGVTPATETSPATGAFGGYECTPNSSFSNFTFTLVDAGEPGRNDRFTISYVTDDGPPAIEEGGQIRSGNIQVHK